MQATTRGGAARPVPVPPAADDEAPTERVARDRKADCSLREMADAPRLFAGRHVEILRETGLQPDAAAASQMVAATTARSFDPVKVFRFYDDLTRAIPCVITASDDGGLALGREVARQRKQLATLHGGGPADAIGSLLERLELALLSADTKWARSALTSSRVSDRILALDKQVLPQADKSWRMLSLATAQPNSMMMVSDVFDTVHSNLIHALLNDPLWSNDADESRRGTAPDIGSVFRFYAQVRELARRIPAAQVPRCGLEVQIRHAIELVTKSPELRFQSQLLQQLELALAELQRRFKLTLLMQDRRVAGSSPATD